MFPNKCSRVVPHGPLITYNTTKGLCFQYLTEVFPQDFNDSKSIGMWTAIPYGCMWVSATVFSLTADWLITRKIFSITVTRLDHRDPNWTREDSTII